MQTTLTSQTPAVVYLASLLDCGRAISIKRQHVYPRVAKRQKAKESNSALGAMKASGAFGIRRLDLTCFDLTIMSDRNFIDTSQQKWRRLSVIKELQPRST